MDDVTTGGLKMRIEEVVDMSMEQSAQHEESPRSRTASSRRRAHAWLPYALIAPAVVFELIVHVIPMLVGIWISFLKLNQYFLANWANAPFIGFQNYSVAIDLNEAVGQELLQSFLITCAFTILVVGISWVFGMAGAVALQHKFRGRQVLRTVFLIPYALPAYAGIIAWKFMFQQNSGVINSILLDLHLTHGRPFWLIGNNAFPAMVVVAIWRLWPFAFLMLTAGLQSIPQDVYEAAEVDGAGPWADFRKITLPMLKPVNFVLLLVTFLWTFNDFNTPFVLFGATQPPAGDLISFHVYNTSFSTLAFGRGSAMSVLLLLFLLIVSAIFALTNRSRSHHA